MATQDAASQLRAMHARIRSLCDRVVDVPPVRRNDLLQDLHRQVQMLFLLEENVVGPEVRSRLPPVQAQNMGTRARVGRATIDRAFAQLYGLDPATKQHQFQLEVLREGLLGHLHEDGRQWIDALLRLVPEEQRLALGARTQETRASLLHEMAAVPAYQW